MNYAIGWKSFLAGLEARVDFVGHKVRESLVAIVVAARAPG